MSPGTMRPIPFSTQIATKKKAQADNRTFILSGLKTGTRVNARLTQTNVQIHIKFLNINKEAGGRLASTVPRKLQHADQHLGSNNEEEKGKDPLQLVNRQAVGKLHPQGCGEDTCGGNADKGRKGNISN